MIPPSIALKDAMQKRKKKIAVDHGALSDDEAQQAPKYQSDSQAEVAISSHDAMSDLSTVYSSLKSASEAEISMSHISLLPGSNGQAALDIELESSDDPKHSTITQSIIDIHEMDF